MMNRDWIDNQVRVFKLYEGFTVEKVMIYEMAFIENREGMPQFEHPDCPFIQAHVLYFWLNDERIIKVHTYQNDCEWSIGSDVLTSTAELPVGVKEDLFFRFVECDKFPLGLIDSIVAVINEDGNISEVSISINGDEILLKSGEVYEQADNSLSIHSDDETVLIFLNPENVNQVVFHDV